MRKLHVVGFTSDLDGLIFSTRKGSKSGSFVVSISDELLDKLAEAERLRNGEEAQGRAATPERPSRREEREAARGRSQSELTPREIQARLRAGRTIDDVAKEARCTREWIERFAAPILAEQAQVIELARSFTYTKARLGESALPLGESVRVNLADKGVLMLADEFDQAWSAFQLHDGVWLVRFHYRSRGRAQQASWEVDLASRHVTSRDRLASDLGYVDAGRGRRAAEIVADAVPEEAEPAPARSRTRGRAVGRSPAAASRARKSGTATARKATRKRTTPARASRSTVASGGSPTATRARTKGTAAPAGRSTRPATTAKTTGVTAKTTGATAKSRAATAKASAASKQPGRQRRTAKTAAAVPRAPAKRAPGRPPTKAVKAAKGTKATAPAATRAPTKRSPRSRPSKTAAGDAPTAGVSKQAAPGRVPPAPRTPSAEAPAEAEPQRRGSGGAVLRSQTRPPEPPPAAEAVAEKSAPPEPADVTRGRGARLLAARPAGPRFGTDGTRLSRPLSSARPSGPPRTASPMPPRAVRPAPAPAAGSGNGSRASSPPPLSERLRRVSPGAPAAPGASSSSSARPRPAEVEFEPDIELEAAPDVPRVRSSIFGERPSPPSRPPIALGGPDDSGDDGDDEGDWDRGSRSGDSDADADAFVIRPRISAKQASELTFNESRPSWRDRLRKGGSDLSSSSFSVATT